MKDYISTPSLETYLNPNQNNFTLKIPLTTEDPPTLEKISFPFLLITDSDPLARLLDARFMTAAESEIKKVLGAGCPSVRQNSVTGPLFSSGAI